MAIASILIIFFVTIFTQLPVAIVLGISSLGAILASGDYPLIIIISRMFSGIDSYTLIAIPMFILAGSLLNESGATMRMLILPMLWSDASGEGWGILMFLPVYCLPVCPDPLWLTAPDWDGLRLNL